MKKLYTLLVSLVAINIANAQYVTIPDPNFAAWLNANIPAAMSGNQMDTTSSAVTASYIVTPIIVNCGNGVPFILTVTITRRLTSSPCFIRTFLCITCWAV